MKSTLKSHVPAPIVISKFTKLSSAIIPRLMAFGCLTLGIAGITAAGIAAPPTAPANPFNAQVITNPVISPANPPSAAEIQQVVHVKVIKTLQKLSTQNIQSVGTRVTTLATNYEKLQEKFANLSEDEKGRDDVQKELKNLKKELAFQEALRSLYQRKFDFLRIQLAQIAQLRSRK